MLPAHRYRMNFADSPYCEYCESKIEATTEHVLLVCKNFQKKMGKERNAVIRLMQKYNMELRELLIFDDERFIIAILALIMALQKQKVLI